MTERELTLQPARKRTFRPFTPSHAAALNANTPIVEYYTVAGMDYEPWSRNYNMHFGYYRWGLNPFNLEAMLEEMNRQILKRLGLHQTQPQHLIDLGCGVGSCAAFATQQHANVRVTGISIVEPQIAQARARHRHWQTQLDFEVMDYRRQTFPNNHFDGAYAIESSCYDRGKAKRAFLAETFRTLKPGARLVVADGFTRTDTQSKWFNYCYRKVCDGWALQDFASIDAFTEQMAAIGYTNIRVEDSAWRVAPSIAFVPWVSLRYLFGKLLKLRGENRVQWGHFLAPLFGILLGLQRSRYSYFIVTATKPGP